MRPETKTAVLAVILAVLIAALGVVVAMRVVLESATEAAETAAEPTEVQPISLEAHIHAATEKAPENATGPVMRPALEPDRHEAEPDETQPVEEPEVEPAPVRNERYATIEISDEEIEELAQVTFAEAGNQSAEGQQAVVEVILNRVLHTAFPDTVHDVLHQDEHTKVPQFSTVYSIGRVEPNAMQYAAIEAALYGTPILDLDVVFFSREGENNRVWGRIGDHVFCRAYIWE